MRKSKMLTPEKIQILDSEDNSPDAIAGRQEEIITMKICTVACTTYCLKESVALKLFSDLGNVLEARLKKKTPEAGTHQAE